MTANNVAAGKFGGTSVESGPRIRHVAQIVRNDARRKAVVVSAPSGVTNMLIAWASEITDPELTPETEKILMTHRERDDILHAIEQRFVNIASFIRSDIPVRSHLNDFAHECRDLRRHGRLEDLRHFAAHYGEELNSQLVAEACGYKWHGADFIKFDSNGNFDWNATEEAADQHDLPSLVENGVVIPGFYGRMPDGAIHTFSRGGSDITGAIVARLIGAHVYENWTDVEGVLSADPRLVKNARKNDVMTYKELRELSFMGAKMFHESAVAIVRKAGIPIHLRSTMTPERDGTWIVESLPEGIVRPHVTGVAMRNGFSIITIEKYGMDDIMGILSDSARIFTENNVSVNVTSSIDSMTFIVETSSFNKVADKVLNDLQQRFLPDDLRREDGIALVCTVGEGMRNTRGISAAVDMALWKAGVNIKLELQGGSEINIIRGVKDTDGPKAVQAIHDAPFPH